MKPILFALIVAATAAAPVAAQERAAQPAEVVRSERADAIDARAVIAAIRQHNASVDRPNERLRVPTDGLRRAPNGNYTFSR